MTVKDDFLIYGPGNVGWIDPLRVLNHFTNEVSSRRFIDCKVTCLLTSPKFTVLTKKVGLRVFGGLVITS